MENTNKNLFLLLIVIMGITIIVSNYLVQFPIYYFNLNKVLTYGALSYPITFLITDLGNRSYGKKVARKIVYVGFFIGILLTVFVSTNFNDIISIRIAIGSGTAFLIAQLIDIEIFQILRFKKWFVAPITSSILGSIIDTFLFFSISFYGTNMPWVSLAFGDLLVKLIIAIIMLVPFRLLIFKIKDANNKNIKKIRLI